MSQTEVRGEAAATVRDTESLTTKLWEREVDAASKVIPAPLGRRHVGAVCAGSTSRRACATRLRG